jgi:hypothetical protein
MPVLVAARSEAGLRYKGSVKAAMGTELESSLFTMIENDTLRHALAVQHC